ncbi:MAG TPA: prolyl oligopeptidase family serine peptidase [Candidatus Ozemobacteraceae bacterium]
MAEPPRSNRFLLLACTAVAFCLLVAPVRAQQSWKQPSPRVTTIIDTPPTPTARLSPRGGRLLLIRHSVYVPLSELAQPLLRLAGIRFSPISNIRQRTSFMTGGSVLDLATLQAVELQFPPDGKGCYPTWSPDGKAIAIVFVTTGGSELWTFDVMNGQGRCLARGLNDLLTVPYQWEFRTDTASPGYYILANITIPDRGDPPPAPQTPPGPITEEASGIQVKARTFQDLLRTAHHDALFQHYASSQLIRIDPVTASATPLGQPGLLTQVDPSPDGRFLLTDRLLPPFSHTVPASLFAHVFEVRDASSGAVVRKIAQLPAGEQIPINGVATGPRSMRWIPLLPATLFWAEALDGGDPLASAAFRDRLFTSQALSDASPTAVTELPQRFDGAIWLASPGLTLISEYDEEREWTKTRMFDLQKPSRAADAPLLFDRSITDEYADPGEPLWETRPDGQTIARMVDGAVLMKGDGATPDGNYPFLRAVDPVSHMVRELFRSASGSYEMVLDIADASATSIITRHETPTTPPNYRLVPLSGTTATGPVQVTRFADPAPELTAIRKELIRYHRADGIPLSATLYYPVGYTTGTRVPTVIWAYPREYTATDTAAQVRAEPNRFTQPQGSSILFLLLDGYAVLMDAEIPVVGKPREANDTFVEQISAGAQAAVDELVRRGIAEPHRIAVGGHSYGAAMVANLLAHTDLFAAGIARSGAYNRTLTPFGFQGERRTYWQAPEVYHRLSAFSYADRIKEPLLLVHGELDENTGTFPLQSERLFAAIRGHGGTARFVVLPFEGHGYRSREGILHTLAETTEWLDRHLGRQATPSPTAAPIIPPASPPSAAPALTGASPAAGSDQK